MMEENKEFDFLDYYKNKLKTRGEKTYFRVLISKKFNLNPRTFHQWVYRGDVPGYAQVIIQDIIKDPAYKLPQYK